MARSPIARWRWPEGPTGSFSRRRWGRISCPPSGASPRREHGGAGMSLRVLLVDDHQVMRQGLRALLEREHFHVVGEASNGRDAVQHAEKLRPDIAVIDLGMPELNGLDAAQQIGRASPATKVIALTMHTEDAYVTAALRAGVK